MCLKIYKKTKLILFVLFYMELGVDKNLSKHLGFIYTVFKRLLPGMEVHYEEMLI